MLITGALGCLGAWTVRQLLEHGDLPVAFDQSADRHRLDLLFSDEELGRVTFVQGDVSLMDDVARAMDDNLVDAVIHLAALQVPSCAANPPLGALVNVVGTVNVFEAVRHRRDRIRSVVYASSAAVYGIEDAASGDGLLPEDAVPHPTTHYGAYKLANEATARAYWQTDRLPSIGIRPYVVFGLGRDQGMTSSPTKAMLAAALQSSYEIRFGGHYQLHYAPDVARAFVVAARHVPSGPLVFNLGGELVDMTDVVHAIEAVAPEIQGRISLANDRLPFPSGFSSSLPGVLHLPPATPFRDAVKETVDAFRAAASAGQLSAGDLS